MIQLESRLDSQVNLGATPGSLSPLERNMEFLDTSIDEDYFHCSNLKGISRCLSQLEMRPEFSEAT